MNTLDVKELRAQLEERYGPIVGQNIIDLINAYEEGGSRTMDCLAMVQLSELTHRVRADVRKLIAELRLWDNIATLLTYNSLPVGTKTARVRRWLEQDRHAAELVRMAERLQGMEAESASWEALNSLMAYNRDFVQSKLLVLRERFAEELALSKRLWRDFLIMYLSYLRRYDQEINEKTLRILQERALADSAAGDADVADAA